ncbi:cytochrome P450 [Pseudonocardia eucalypti]|nr:cytochrome P450 [Pseudonocardia eucalypti]
MRYGDASTVLTGRGFGRGAAAAAGSSAPLSASLAGGCPTLGAFVDNWLVFMDPPRHTAVRAVVADCLAQRIQEGLAERARDIVGELVADLADNSRIELVGDYATVVPMLVILEALGVPRTDWTWMCGRTAALQQASTFRPGNRAQRLAAAEDAAHDFDEYFRRILSSRRRAPGNDLISALVAASWSDGEGADDLLVATCVHLLASGNETMRTALSKIVLLLLRHANLLDRLLDQPRLVPAAVDELIRFDSPAQMVTRWAYRDACVGGRDIHRGDKVTVVLGSANRDPASFPDPDVIRLDRRNRRHCGFGMGIHYCLGSALGRMETEIGVGAIVKLLPRLRIDGEQLVYGEDLIFHGPLELWLRRV